MASLSDDTLLELVKKHGTPLYVYDANMIAEKAARISRLTMPFGKTIRYAMKANPHPDIVRLLYRNGVQIDASSSYEAEKALRLGVEPAHVLLTSQQSPHDMDNLIRQKVPYNATSLHQLELYGRAAPGTTVGLRVNPGIGSGHSTKTNVGGVSSSFGIWHEYIDEALAIAQHYDLTIIRVHTHIGSGTNPSIWEQAVEDTMTIVRRVPTASIVNFGGGFKVARMPGEKDTPIEKVGEIIHRSITQFHVTTGRQLHVELEPGTYFVAIAGTLIAQIDDIVDTGADGYRFIKLNTGMNDFLRPTLYGAQHPINVLNDKTDSDDYVIVGHNCESGDVLSVSADDPELFMPRRLSGAAIGEYVAIGGTGAYCASMSAHGYNSFPSAKELMQ